MVEVITRPVLSRTDEERCELIAILMIVGEPHHAIRNRMAELLAENARLVLEINEWRQARGLELLPDFLETFRQELENHPGLLLPDGHWLERR